MKPILLKFLSLLLIKTEIQAGIFDAHDPDYWTDPDPPSVSNQRWMSRLPNNKLVSEISVPGTHETMAREGGPAYWCQGLSIKDQMNRLGIRFFDIRCRLAWSTLFIHHGAVYQRSTFCEVLDEATYFLSVFPSDIIFMRVKQEYSQDSDTIFDKTVREHISRYPQYRFWLSSRIPTVEEARGKIIILREFDTQTPPFGIPYHSLNIADDHYQPSYHTKWNGVWENLERAQSGSSSTMYLTYNSGSFIAPRDMARTLNTKLHDYVRGRRERLGIIAMDYPGPKLAQDIIDSNF